MTFTTNMDIYNPISSQTTFSLEIRPHVCITQSSVPRHPQKETQSHLLHFVAIGGVILQVTSPPAKATGAAAGGGEGGLKKDQTGESLG